MAPPRQTAQDLGLPAGYGRTTRRYRALKAAFKRLCRRQQRPCWLCGHEIDYDLGPDHGDSWSLDHFHPRSTHLHLAEDPANFRAAHLTCNKARGNRAAAPNLGETSREW